MAVTTPPDYSRVRGAYQYFTPVVPGTPFARCHGLLVTVGGLADLTGINNVVVPNVPLAVGYNPLQCTNIAVGATATGIFALYFGNQ